jgi:hypothetical protein
VIRGRRLLDVEDQPPRVHLAGGGGRLSSGTAFPAPPERGFVSSQARQEQRRQSRFSSRTQSMGVAQRVTDSGQ